MTTPAPLPGPYADGDTPPASELNTIVDNVDYAVDRSHVHAGGRGVIANASFNTAAFVDVVGASVTVTVGIGQQLKLSFSGKMNYGSGADVLDVNIAVLEFREGVTGLAANRELQWRAQGIGGVGQETLTGFVVINPTAGTHTYKIAARRSAGARDYTIIAGELLVEVLK